MDEASESDPRVAALPDRTLLVLDDDAPFRTRLARAMSQRGFDVVAAGTAAEAREALRKQAPAKGAVIRIVWPRAAIEAPAGWTET